MTRIGLLLLDLLPLLLERGETGLVLSLPSRHRRDGKLTPAPGLAVPGPFAFGEADPTLPEPARSRPVATLKDTTLRDAISPRVFSTDANRANL
jgi:hypothetical protein